jgi:hypothetical protein
MLKLRLLKQSLLGQSLLVLALLLGQQGSALHSLRHAFAEQTQQQQKKNSPAAECEQCISYAQFSGTLYSAKLSFDFGSSFTETFSTPEFLLLSTHTLTAVARGPPTFHRPV